MAKSSVYTSIFTNPVPNGWHNEDVAQDTPIDAPKLQVHTDTLEALDKFFNGFDKDKVNAVKKKILTKAEYDALPDTKYSDGVIYFITDGGSGAISYPNYEQEAF